MFTGIVEEKGKILEVSVKGKSGFIRIACKSILDGTKVGDSIAVNGVCLTVTDFDNDSFRADVMAESLRRTNLGLLAKGSKVNLERAMKADGRFGGHIVTGHIDGTGIIEKIEKEENAIWFYIRADSKTLGLIVEKGSVAINGISLTVADLQKESFGVSVIPHTAEVTNLGDVKTGDTVNLENDIIGKYVQRLIGGRELQGSFQDSTDNKLMAFLGD